MLAALLALQFQPGCYSRRSMSTPHLSQSYACQSLVSKLITRTTFKFQDHYMKSTFFSQTSGIPMGTTLDIGWTGNWQKNQVHT